MILLPYIYTDEAYTDNRKKMAVCDESIMWLAYYGFSSGEFLGPPSNDETLVQKILFLFVSHVFLLPKAF